MKRLRITDSPAPLGEKEVRAAFCRWRGDDHNVVVARAPGRLNIIGEHTDYNEGLVLPMILDRSVYVACRPVEGKSHLVRSEDYDANVTFQVGTLPQVPKGHWATYVAGMLLHIPPGTAIEMLVTGNVPLGSGLSSSAALEMATGLAAEAVSGKRVAPEAMARIGQQVEHAYLNVKCGLMDQMISRIGRSMHALLLDCRSFEWAHIPVPDGEACFVIVNSQVRRKLAQSKYNERRQECDQALEWFNNNGAAAASLRDITLSMIEDSSGKMPAVQLNRARHMVEENARVLSAVEALRDGDWVVLGRLITASHRSLQHLFDVSCSELDHLVDLALDVEGVYGARMMGGGFGGCTLNLVQRSAVDEFVTQIVQGYRKACGFNCTVLKTGPGVEAAAF